MKHWINDLRLGVRLSVAGGREGWLRTALTALGVGLGVALLLVSVSVPHMLSERSHRGDQRDYDIYSSPNLLPSDKTLLLAEVAGTYHRTPIRGMVLRPEGPAAPVPPGLAHLPAAGEFVVSPALADLLTSTDGALLRDRFPGTITGIIGDEGLAGPNELAYYQGSNTLSTNDGVRIDHFGEFSPHEALDAILSLLVLVAFIVLLLPIGIFVSAAIRFGSDRRDRRLAAIRLVGASSAMSRRIAAGEALTSAVLGLVVGGVFFFLGRQLIEEITLQNLSVYAGDVRPNVLLALIIVAAVPFAAVGLTLVSLRRVLIEPLGVVRQSRQVRRRLWWRLAVPALGLLLLLPLLRGIDDGFNAYQVGAGLVLLLLGTSVLLPWVVAAVVRRMGRGGVSWQLAVRRLQLDSTTSVRAVTGVAVATAGAIALQMFFGAADAHSRTRTGEDPNRAQISTHLFGSGPHTPSAETIAAKLRATAGVTSEVTFSTYYGNLPTPVGADHEPGVVVYVGSCDVLAELAAVSACADGDSFTFGPRADDPERIIPGAGQQVIFHPDTGLSPAAADKPDDLQWTIPADASTINARRDPGGRLADGVFLTPAAATTVLPDGASTSAEVQSYLSIDQARVDAVEYVRNTAAAISPTMQVEILQEWEVTARFADIRRGLFTGAVAVLLLIGASLLVSMVEQLRERRRLFAVLVAFGTRRSTLTWSVLWQAALPVGLGVVLAGVTGAGLGALLLKMVGAPVRFDWGIIGGVSAAATGVVLLVTLLSLPALWRITRPDGLRTE